jgi:hypothetical protein
MVGCRKEKGERRHRQRKGWRGKVSEENSIQNIT